MLSRLKKILFFDREDRQLADLAVFDPKTAVHPDLSFEQLHPAGILELVEPRSLRIIRAVSVILGTSGSDSVAVQRRLAALTQLREEVRTGLDVPLPLNTGRVLLAWGKELLRCPNREQKVAAAHSLRTALLGNPLFIRRQLKRFHLLEMPENSLPVTFDYHVHDSNTKGRKSPTHLIMDAWIKGVRKLQVIYYNVVPPDAAAELLKAAELLDIDLRIGVEFRTCHRGQWVDLIWVPRGFSGADDFLKFLSRHKTAEFTTKCVEAAKFRRRGGWKNPPTDSAELPELNRLSPAELIAALHRIASGFRIVLNLTGLSAASVIELLYECRGGITTLEIYNLKDAREKTPRCERLINRVRHALNSGDVVKLKYILRDVLKDLQASGAAEKDAPQLAELRKILLDMPNFVKFYARSPLGVSLGSDSVGRASATSPGMGMAVADSLPKRARQCASRDNFTFLPVRAQIFEQLSYEPGAHWFKKCIRREWFPLDQAAQIGHNGNIIALGGQEAADGITQPSWLDIWSNVNSQVKIGLKILIGFAAAFLTFYWSATPHSWWVLTYFGAAIWLGITLLRNIVQQALAGGSLRSSKLLKLNDFISWQRIADSLFYTGLSVPLLEYVVKTLLLQRGLGLTAETAPIAVYTGIGIANGIYLTTHNLIRAFPAGAVWGNWLRVPLSIPLALVINSTLGTLLASCGLAGVDLILQQWAAVISKAASDTVGGIVEAMADRARYIAARESGLDLKLHELGSLIAEVELLTPEDDLLQTLQSGKSFADIAGIERNFLLERLYINTLDLMYMWMRQPRAIEVACSIIKRTTPEERAIFWEVQKLLRRERPISQFLLAGALGGNFAPALTFYLRWNQLYLKELRRKISLA